LYPKWRIAGATPGLAVALVVPTTLPTGDEDNLQGNESVTVRPRIAADVTLASGTRFGANLGYVVRPNRQQFMNVDVGHQFAFKAAWEQPIVTGQWAFLTEIYGKTGLDPQIQQVEAEEVPLELILGGRWWPAETHSLTFGAGPGLTVGYGTPTFRAFVGYSYTQSPESDSDGDGLVDANDECPGTREDRDGYRDDDGCPDRDNDGDGLEDENDACPSVAEDDDGYQDDDGCPDPDNDGDGLDDGEDECADEAEDFDGFEDGDGCPDPDNDTDGIDDPDDQCPGEKEVYNGVRDDDGCPDQGEAGVEVTREKLVIKEKVFFEYDRATIRKKSHSILEQVAGVIRSHPNIALVEIQGHTDARGTKKYNYELSQKRAEAVKDFLVDEGVDPDRLRAVGYGESDPQVPNDSREAMAKNRRVEFIIHQEKTEIEPPDLEEMKELKPDVEGLERPEPSGPSDAPTDGTSESEQGADSEGETTSDATESDGNEETMTFDPSTSDSSSEGGGSDGSSSGDDASQSDGSTSGDGGGSDDSSSGKESDKSGELPSWFEE
ncbi:MAG: OmpA family protein, partial [Bradymonadaceae bacterium]